MITANKKRKQRLNRGDLFPSLELWFLVSIIWSFKAHISELAANSVFFFLLLLEYLKMNVQYEAGAAWDIKLSPSATKLPRIDSFHQAQKSQGFFFLKNGSWTKTIKIKNSLKEMTFSFFKGGLVGSLIVLKRIPLIVKCWQRLVYCVKMNKINLIFCGTVESKKINEMIRFAA